MLRKSVGTSSILRIRSTPIPCTLRRLQPDGRVAHFELVLCKSVDTYVRVKQNQNQVVWKWRKVRGSELSSQCRCPTPSKAVCSC